MTNLTEREIGYTVDLDAIVAAAPPLTPAQRADLALLVGPVVAELAEERAQSQRRADQ